MGVNDVRAVRMDQDASTVEALAGIAAYVRALIDHQHALAGLCREPLGQHTAAKSGADDQLVKAAIDASKGGGLTLVGEHATN